MLPEIKKYPRTRHVRGSRFQHGDHDLEAVPWSELEGKHLVVEEKIDGANCGISFHEGKLLLQSRGHYLRGGSREKHFDLFKQWAASQQDFLYGILGERYVMYGEWMAAKHTAFYDALPHYFMEFDIYDRENDVFESTSRRSRIITGGNTKHRDQFPYPIVPVKVLYEGSVASLGALANMITRSNFITNDRAENLRLASMAAGVQFADALSHTDMHPEMEGLYVKWEEDSVVKGRYKYVRSSFTNAILDQEQHWHDRPIVLNKLLPGAYDRMFT